VTEQCPFCLDGIAAPVRRCSGCELQVHAECAEEFGACPTVGCGGGWGEPAAPSASKPRRLEVDLASPAAPPAINVKAAPAEPLSAQATAEEASPRAGRRRLWRWAAALILLLLGGLWLADTLGPKGQERALGGWFSGHGSSLSAVLGALTRKGYDKDLGNVPVVDVAVQTQGEFVASAAADGEVILWDARDGSELRQLHWPRIAPREGPVRIAFDGPGERLFLQCGSIAAWIEVRSGRYRQLSDVSVGKVVAIAPCERGVRFAHEGEQELLVSEVREERLLTIGALPTPRPMRAGVAFAEGGRRVFVSLGGLHEFDLERNTRRTHPLAVGSSELAVSPRGDVVAWVGKKGAVLARLGGEPRQLEPDWGSWGFTGLAFSPDGSKLAAGRLSGGLWVWSVESGERIHAWDGPVAGEGPAWSADSKLALTWGRDQKVRLYRASR